VPGFERLAEVDAVLICVPTPLGADGAPDLSALRAAARSVAWNLHPGQLVVVESTSWPGTTREVVQPILEATGLRVGRDVFLAFSPEREDPGNRAWRTAAIPRLVAGADTQALHLAETLYAQVVERVVPVESLEVAEAAKLTENVFRAVNIALANELKLVFGRMGIDVWQVMQAAGTKPFGFLPFWPGPGLGGHCIPVDPAYLTWQARRSGVASRLVELALSINGAMPQHVLARLAAAQPGGRLAGRRVLVLGVAYKPNIADVRESPGLRLMALIEAAGGEAVYHDPLVPEIPAGTPLAGRRSVSLSEGIAGCGSALIVTDHDGVDYAEVAAALPVVVDTRNVCARLGIRGSNVLAA
jgi:UDP-N-acetyl-D-glucosamine dehydrogenase